MGTNKLNLKWKEIQTEYQYENVLKYIQRIIIKTDLSNRYSYTKLCEDHPDYVEANKWFITKNGNIQNNFDDLGNITGVKYVTIIQLKDILTGFFEDVDPITKIPNELPIDVQLR